MEQIKYQGYARERGFNPTQMSTASVEAIGQQGNNLLRQMQQNSDIERRNRDAYQSQVERNQGIEAQNRSENRQFERASDRAVFEGRANNLKTQANNYLIKSEDTEKAFAALAGLSGTLAKEVTNIRKAKYEKDLNEAYALRMSGQVTPGMVEVQQKLSTLRAADEKAQTIADKLEDSNAPAEVVHATRKLTSKGAQAGLLKAEAQLAVLDYPGFLESRLAADDQTQITVFGPDGPKTITPSQAQGPIEQEAVFRQLLPDFLRQRGLWGANPDFLADSLFQMRKAEQSLLDRERDSFIKASSAQMLDIALTEFEAGLSVNPVEAWSNALSKIRHYKNKENQRFEWAGARDYLIDQIVDIGSMSALNAIGDSPSPLNPKKTWREMHPDLFADAEEKMRSQSLDSQRLREAELGQEGKLVARNIISEFAKNPPSRENAEQVFKAYVQKYGSNSDLEQWALKYNADSIDEAATDKNLDQMARNGLLQESDLDRPEIPLNLRNKYRGFVQQRAKAVEEAGGKEKLAAIKERIEAIAGWYGTKGQPKDYTIGLAVAAAQRRFNDLLSMNLRGGGGDPAQAVNSAAEAVFAEINDPKGSFQYQNSPNGEGFQRFRISAGSAGVESSMARLNYLQAKVSGAGNSAIAAYQMIPANILKQTADNYTRTGKLVIPPVADQISALYGGKITAARVIAEQINLYNKTAQNKLDPIIPPNAGGAEGAGPMSPELRRIYEDLSYFPSRATVNRFAVMNNSVPQYVRQGREGFGDVLNMATSLGHPVPVLAAAQWALETGYGKSLLATTQNNLFGVKSYNPSGNGWQRYGGHTESVKAYVENITKNPRYKGVLTAKTPREAVLAVAAGGYAGGEASYPNKLIRLLRENGINPDVPYVNPTGNRWHQPGTANVHLSNAIGKRLLAEMTRTSGFGSQESFRKKPHEGNDYSVNQNSRMSLSRPARVVDVIAPSDPNHGGYGGMVELEFDDGTRSRVAHLSKVFVKKGDVVAPKKIFAHTGGAPGTPGAGRSTGPHVHLEQLNTAMGRQETTKGKRDPSGIANRFYIDS